MTSGVSRNRRRPLSLSSSIASGDLIGQLDRAVETLHHINRALPTMALGRKELIAFGALLVQVSGALLTYTDRLTELHGGHAPPHRRTTGPRDTGPREEPPPVAAGSALQTCRNGIRAANTAARAFLAELG